MASNLRRTAGESWTVIRRVYWRPASRLIGGLYSALGLGSFLLAEFASAKVQNAVLLGVLIPRVPAWIWLAGGVVLVFLLGVWGYVQELRDVRAKHAGEIRAAIAAERARKDASSASALLQRKQRRDYERMRPVLEGRIVPWTGHDVFKYCLQVKILSPEPLSTIFITMPRSDRRLGYAQRDIEAPRQGHTIFRPGEWITVGGVKIPGTEAKEIMGLSAPDTVTAQARCRDDAWTQQWDNIVVNARFELAGVYA